MPDTITREVDNLVRWKGPYKKSANTVLDQTALTAGGGTVTLRVYLEDVEMRMVGVTTRLREEIASGATTATIPHFDFEWLQVGDTIEWRSDNGERQSRAITVYSSGSSIETEATNFATITWSGGVDGICAEGTVLTLIKKAAANKNIPVRWKTRMLTESTGHTVVIETDNPAVTVTAGVVDPVVRIVEASEDGLIAENQDQFYILQCGTLTGSATISDGARIRVKLGDDISMAEYGTPAVGEEDWGFEGTVPDLITQGAVLEHGDQLRLIVTLDGMAGFKDVVSKLVKVVES